MRTLNLQKKYITQVNVLNVLYVLDSWWILSRVLNHYLASGKRKKTVPLWYLHFTATLPKFKQSCYLFIFFQLPWSCKHITTRDAPFGLNSYFKFKYKICKYSAASKRTLLLTKHYFYFKIFLIPKIMLQQKAQNYCSINCGIFFT